MASQFWQVFAVSLVFLAFTSAEQTKESCIEQHRECANACGSDLEKMKKEYADLNKCWLHLDCKTYRTCLNQTSSAPLTSLPESASISTSSPVNSSVSTDKPGRQATSLIGTSALPESDHDVRKPVTEQEPVDVLYPLYAVVTLLVVMAIAWPFSLWCMYRWKNYSQATVAGKNEDPEQGSHTEGGNSLQLSDSTEGASDETSSDDAHHETRLLGNGSTRRDGVKQEDVLLNELHPPRGGTSHR